MLFKFLIFLSLYLPFQLALNVSKGIDLASIRVFIILLFLLWLLEGLKNKRVILKANLSSHLILIFLFLNICSIFFAQNTDWSTRKLLYLFSIFPIYFVASDIINSKEKEMRIIKTIIFSGSIVAFLGILQFLSQFIFGLEEIYKFWSIQIIPYFLGGSLSQTVLEYPSWLVNISGKTFFRSISLFPDPHMFSLFLGLILPLSIGMTLKYKKNIWLFSSVLILLANILTFSRGGYLGLAVGMIFLFLFFWKKVAKKQKRVLFIFLAVSFLVLVSPNPISSRFFSTFNLRDGSNIGRIEMWKKSTEIIINKPFFGSGIGNFSLEIEPGADYRKPIYAHNTYLDIASETGIFSGLVWIGILCLSFFRFIKKSKEDIIYLCLAGSIVIFSVHSLVENGLYSPVVLSLFLILISLNQNKEDARIS